MSFFSGDTTQNVMMNPFLISGIMGPPQFAYPVESSSEEQWCLNTNMIVLMDCLHVQSAKKRELNASK